MDTVKKNISRLKGLILYLFSYIYDICVTYPLTRSIYIHFSKTFSSQSNNKKISMIDVGTGTGTPLKSILDKVNFEKVLAIDINRGYLEKARENFRNNLNVEVRYQDFMTIDKDVQEKYDVVFFGFSLMLLPDREEALRIAQRMLKPNGKIYMFLTLYHKKNKIVEWIKPRLKYVFSIEFGDVVYYDQLSDIIKNAGFKIVSSEKLGWKLSVLLHFFKIYALEVECIDK